MKAGESLLAICASLSIVGLALPVTAQTAVAVMKDASSKEVGKVDLTQTPHGVLLKLSLKGFLAGERAFHVHAVGKCEPPFTNAGGHFNPTGRKHGLAAADGAHAGDMPDLFVPPNGELTVEVANPAMTLVEGKPNSVFDADGSAIIIHAGPDDYKTDPTGNAGDRVACGLIVKK